MLLASLQNAVGMFVEYSNGISYKSREIIQNNLGPIEMIAIILLYCIAIVIIPVLSKHLCAEIVCES